MKYDCTFCGGYEEGETPKAETAFGISQSSLFTIEQGETKYSICAKCVKKIIEKLLNPA